MKQNTKTSPSPTPSPLTGEKEGFTQGKWIFNKHEIGHHFGNITSELGKDERGIMNIRTIGIISKYCGEKEAEANARLIAAAPSLYKLCVAILEDLESGEIENNADTREQAMIQLKTIINKINYPLNNYL